MAKARSFKLDDPPYQEAEKTRRRLDRPRFAHILKAVSHYNALYARKLLERDCRKASRRLGADHLKYLQEPELLEDLPEDL